MNHQIEKLVRNCVHCASVTPQPSKIPEHAWEYMGANFLVVVDIRTK